MARPEAAVVADERALPAVDGQRDRAVAARRLCPHSRHSSTGAHPRRFTSRIACSPRASVCSSSCAQPPREEALAVLAGLGWLVLEVHDLDLGQAAAGHPLGQLEHLDPPLGRQGQRLERGRRRRQHDRDPETLAERERQVAGVVARLLLLLVRGVLLLVHHDRPRGAAAAPTAPSAGPRPRPPGRGGRAPTRRRARPRPSRSAAPPRARRSSGRAAPRAPASARSPAPGRGSAGRAPPPRPPSAGRPRSCPSPSPPAAGTPGTPAFPSAPVNAASARLWCAVSSVGGGGGASSQRRAGRWLAWRKRCSTPLRTSSATTPGRAAARAQQLALQRRPAELREPGRHPRLGRRAPHAPGPLLGGQVGEDERGRGGARRHAGAALDDPERVAARERGKELGEIARRPPLGAQARHRDPPGLEETLQEAALARPPRSPRSRRPGARRARSEAARAGARPGRRRARRSRSAPRSTRRRSGSARGRAPGRSAPGRGPPRAGAPSRAGTPGRS